LGYPFGGADAPERISPFFVQTPPRRLQPGG
jgi:hypothetical protein